MRKNFFSSGLIAAVLVIALGYASCSDDFDYDSSSGQYSEFSGLESENVAYSDLVGDSVQQYAGLVISQIYFTGSGNNPNSNGLINDQYIRITNNSDATIDVGGVVVLESKFNSVTAFYGFTPPINTTDFVTGVIFQIPASRLLDPDESLLLASLKKNYTDSTGINLSCADYEWNAEPETDYSLKKVFSYSETIWVLHNRGFCSYAIAALPGGLAADTTEVIDALGWQYTGNYYLNVNGTVYTYTASKAYAIPNEWIIDAVNVRAPVVSTNVVQTLPPSLDYGYTYAGSLTNNAATTRFRHTVTRLQDPDSGKLLDSNDSTIDFLANDTVPVVCP